MSELSRMRRPFVADVVTTSITNAAMMAAGIVTSIVVARLLGPEGKGVYTVASYFGTALAYNLTLGLAQATTFYSAKEGYSHRRILGHVLIYAAMLGALATFVGLAIIKWLSGMLFPGVSSALLLLGLLTVVPRFLFGLLTHELLGLQDVGHYNLAQLIRALGLLALVTVFLLLLGGSSFAPLMAELVSLCAAAAVALFLVYRRVGGTSWGLDLSFVTSSLRYGLPLYLGNVLVFWHSRIAIFLIGGFLNPTMVGLYTVSLGMAQRVSSLSEGAATVLFSRTSAQASFAESRGFGPLVLRTVLLMVTGALAIVAGVSPWLIPFLYSEAFTDSIVPFRILLPGAVALAGWNVLDSQLKGLGKTGWSAVTATAAVITNLGLSILWIPPYGLVGAAYASSLSGVVAFLVAFAAYCRLSHNDWTILLPHRSDFTMYGRLVTRSAIGLSRILRQASRMAGSSPTS